MHIGAKQDMHTEVCIENFTEANTFEVDGGKRVLLRWLLGTQIVQMLAGLNCFMMFHSILNFQICCG
jgi:hypothetical protein